MRAAKINIDTLRCFVLYFSKRAAPPGNPCSLGTLTGGLPQPTPILYQKPRAVSIRSYTYALHRSAKPNTHEKTALCFSPFGQFGALRLFAVCQLISFVPCRLVFVGFSACAYQSSFLSLRYSEGAPERFKGECGKVESKGLA